MSAAGARRHAAGSTAGEEGERGPFVYRTPRLYEADLVDDELERARIPHYRASEAPAGIRFAMPAAPTAGPSVTFLVVVPGEHAARARELVDSLPVSNEASPGVWDSGMDDNVRSFFRNYAWITLGALAVGVVLGVVSCFRSQLP